MGKKDGGDFTDPEWALPETLRYASTGIDEKALSTSLDQRSRTETVKGRLRRTSAE
jgi:hypothetical protein